MPDSDATLKLLIQMGVVGREDVRAANDLLKETAASTTGTAGATEKLGHAEQEAAGHAEHLHLNHRALHQIMHLIGNETAPELGHALGGALYGPIGLALAAGYAFEALREHIKKTNEDLDALGDKAAEAFSKVKENLFDAIADEEFSTEKVDRFFKRFEDGAKNAQTATESALRVANALEAAEIKRLKAKEEAELAANEVNPGLSEAEKKANALSIKNRYAGMVNQQEDQGLANEVKAKQTELAQKQAELDELKRDKGASQGLTPEIIAAIDHAMMALPEKNAVRRQYETDRAAGQVDYSKIATEAALKNFAESIANVQKSLGEKDDKGKLPPESDKAQAEKLQQQYDDALHSIKAENEIFNSFIVTTQADRDRHQQTLKENQATADDLKSKLEVAKAKVQSDNDYIEQAKAAMAQLKQAADAQKKFNEKITEYTNQVEEARQKLAETTAIANAKIGGNDDATRLAALTARLQEVEKLIGNQRTGGLEGVLNRGESSLPAINAGTATSQQKQDYGALWQLLSALGENNKQISSIMYALLNHTLSHSQELALLKQLVANLSGQATNSHNQGGQG